MSVRAEQAKPENAAGLSAVAMAKADGFFQHSHTWEFSRNSEMGGWETVNLCGQFFHHEDNRVLINR